MNSITLSLEILLALGTQLVIVVSFMVWLKADITQLKRDVCTIMRELGLKDGREPGFVRRSEYELMEELGKERLAAVDQRLHEQEESVRALERRDSGQRPRPC